jgi:hypothetical protein
MNTHIARATSALAVAGVLTGAAYAGVALGRADDVISHVMPDGRQAVYLSDLNGRFDSLPVCVQEDCSDQPFQTGWWLDRGTGDWYLGIGEMVTLLVIDDTAGVR